ncbi:MAG: aminoglycoside phosphotransferase family protein [Rariglobus sp.]|jgi:aminoglycoside phosphotransferase (APT) family kinase protein|nr:aminoglycoside phosphotransferase family protein [Rariglobus sp.]
MRYLPLPRLATDFQQPPTAAEVTALAARLLGSDIAIIEAREIGGGAFNNAFLLTAADEHRSVLRVSPPHTHPLLFHVERHLLRREHALTPWLAAVAPLLPRIAGTDFTGEICPRDAVLSEFIEGENWDAVMSTLTPAENDALWRELAALLRRVHATPAPHFGWPHPEPPHARWSDFILGGIRGLLNDLTRLGLPDAEARAWFAQAECGASALDEITTPRVLHGDPWPKNVLIRRDSPNSNPRIVALLDHERGGFGDPLNEWVFHGCDFPPVFWEAYGPRPTDPATQFRATVYHGTIAIQCLLESTRYPDMDTATPRHHLTTGTDDLRRLLTEV